MKGYLAAHKDINQNINIYDKDEKDIESVTGAWCKQMQQP